MDKLDNFLAQALQLGNEGYSFWTEYLPMIKIFSAIFSLVCLGAIIYLVLRMNLLRDIKKKVVETYSWSDVSEQRVIKAWKEIEERIKTGKEAELKLAIIEADRVLDEVLKVAGYKGETMAERMEQVTPAQLANIEKVWRAHKIRNRIVHESDYKISQQEVLEVLDAYKKAFQEFGLIRE